mmetsp:Transcript_36136/g.61606  ORF Transcript_36136/g.61606 Transcript_36136/m.61606 type:complete len:205 (-) Transcript_36136:343-957(-)
MLLRPRAQLRLQALPHHILLRIGIGLLGLASAQFRNGLLLRGFHFVDARVDGGLDVGGFSDGAVAREGDSLDGGGCGVHPSVAVADGAAGAGGSGGGLGLAVFDGTLDPSLIDIVPDAIGRGLFLSVFAFELFGARFARLGAGGSRCGGGHGIGMLQMRASRRCRSCRIEAHEVGRGWSRFGHRRPLLLLRLSLLVRGNARRSG